MVVAEAFVLLAIGLLAGILSTVFDVLVCGCASFLSHFALWVLLNALIAVHVESRTKAIWWAVPFNLGYIEGYFITTVASFESYAKSLMVPLAAVAFISPLLTYAVWTARSEKNTYGRALSLLVVACTLVTSYVLNQGIGIYDIVVCALIALVLLVLPARRLKIERVSKAAIMPELGEVPDQEVPAAELAQRGSQGKKRSFAFRRQRSAEHATAQRGARGSATPSEQVPEGSAQPSKAARNTPRPTRRTGGGVERKGIKRLSFRQRRANRNQETREREERLQAAAERRAGRRDADSGSAQPTTLGNARTARRSTRSA